MTIPRLAVARALIVVLLAGAAVVATPLAASAVTGSIQGSVTGGGVGLPSSYVSAFDATTGLFVAGANTNAGGIFAITGLDAGSYRVYAEHPYQSTYASKWFGNSYSFANAYTTVLPQGGNTGGTNIALDAGVTITGSVTAAANGMPVQGASVQAFDVDGRYEYASTDASGNYSIAGVGLGPIRMAIAKTGYASEWYSDQPSLRLATAFTAPSGTSVVRDVALAIESTLSGTMTDAAGTPLSGMVVAYEAGGTADSLGTLVAAATITGSGQYTLHGLPVGSYKLGFTHHSSGYDERTGALLESPEGYVSQWLGAKFSYSAGQTVLAPSAGYTTTLQNVYLFQPHFADVTDHTSPFYGAIEWVAATNISTGTPNPPGKPLYKPADAVSRQAMASFLYKLYSPPSFTPPASPTFADVPTSSSLYTAIEWMYAQGISAGTPQGGGSKPLYKPADPVTRQSMAVFLYRYATGQTTGPPPTTADFADVPVTASTAYAIHWMAEAEISTGTAQPSGLPLYKPADAVSRQSMALFLYRLAYYLANQPT